MNAQNNRGRTLVLCLLLAATVAAVYWPVRHFAFVNIDDNVYVSANSHVQQGLKSDQIKWAFQTDACSNWHPLTWLSHMLDWQLFGPNSGAHHLTSVLVHIANCLLLFLLWQRMTGMLWRSAFLAAIFALHPLRVESVAWVAERKDVLGAFFGLLSLWAYVCYIQKIAARSQKLEEKVPRSGSWRCPIFFYLLTAIFYLLSLMSKSMLVTLPFLLLLLDYWPLGRLQFSAVSTGKPSVAPLRLVLEKIPFFLLAAAASATAYFVQKNGGAVASLDKLSFSARLQNTAIAYVHYLQSFFWPKDLAVLYPHPGFWPPAFVIASTATLLILSLAVWLGRRKRPYLLVGWLWYLGALVPVIGIVQIGVQAYADRYTYIPMIGIAAALTWGPAEFIARWKSRLFFLYATIPAVLLALIVATSVQVQYWRNDETLFSRAVAATKENAIAQNNLGFALARQGKFDEAIQHYLPALAINPDYAEARFNLALAYSEEHRWSEAIEQYTLGLQRRPDAQANNNLGSIYANQGRLNLAVAQYSKALQSEPNHPEARNNLGKAFGRMGKAKEEIDQYEQTLRAHPDYLPARVNLATALLRQGRCEEARQQFLQVLQARPDDLAARNNLGSAYLRQERYAEAAETYRQALQYHPESYQAHFNLAIALARIGQKGEATSELEATLRLNPDFSQAKEQLRILSEQAAPVVR